MLVIAGCRCTEPPAGGEDPAAREPVATQVAAFAAQMVELGALVPDPAELQEAPCPDEELGAELDGGFGRMLLVDHDYLERFARPELEPYAGEREPWQVLTAKPLREIRAPRATDDVRRLTDLLFRIQRLEQRYRYYAVVLASQQRLPREEGARFHPGAYAGWLVVVDRQARQRLCQAEVAAESSAEVAGYASVARNAVLWQDFRRHLDRTLHSAASRITRRLELATE